MCPRYPIFFTFIVLLLSIVCRSGSDCSAKDVLIKDGSNQTIPSPRKTFELGFFTPDGSFNKGRYLGIWYYQSRPKIVVWVANRDRPLSETNGCLAIRDGIAMVLDAQGTIYWSTNSAVHGRKLKKLDSKGLKRPNSTSASTNVSAVWQLELYDAGNLILKSRRDRETLWQSFDHPTDTFLPGMSSVESLNLTSWQTRNNPASGNFTLQLQQKLLTINYRGSNYWENGETGFDEIPQDLFELLLRNDSQLETNSPSRLVMNFTGQVQFWKQEGEKGWSLIWLQPKDRCSFDNKCGDFGSCNSDNGRLCKCLPGFEPNALDEWNSGDFSGGCRPKSESCSRTFEEDKFVELPMMKLGASNHNRSTAYQDCETKCREECRCVAYSCDGANCKQKGTLAENGCWMWTSTDLTNLQEEYSKGITIFIRANPSDIEKTSRDCNPCGTNVIPYPLSTAANCGDPAYKNFQCNTSIGRLDFSTSKGSFKVTAISPEANRFTIQIRNLSNCETKNLESLLSPHDSLPFNVTNCSLKIESFAEVERSFIGVEIAWKPPLEPACNASSDCLSWPNTTCEAAAGGKMRCICGSKFQWDGNNLKCIRVKFPVKVVVSCISGALAVVLLCGMFFIHHAWKRRMAKRQGSVQFPEDDPGGIDVPFFDWGSIVTATNNFADENKLGTGGFGTVYKGKLPNGQEIAVKRLSSVSERGIEEFRTEVVLIAKLQHRNLVRLLGYGLKADERILLYEFMPNGSLDCCLFDQTRSVFLYWEKRFAIIFGIARGLLYLHQDSRFRIIHRDLKPSNILLDEEMNPKISDFGIARIVGGKETEGSTKRVVGTYGYMSPEYAYEGLFSVKSDVFSFGVVMLETISCRRNSKLFQLEHGLNLQGYAWKLWNEDRGLDLMDQALKESCNKSEVLKCIHIGLLCVQEDPIDRPTMSGVVLMLGSENAGLPPPKQPAFVSKKEPSETASSSSVMNSSFNNEMTFSTEGR